MTTSFSSMRRCWVWFFPRSILIFFDVRWSKHTDILPTAMDIYKNLHDKPWMSKQEAEEEARFAGMSEAEKKKEIRKLRKAQFKAEEASKTGSSLSSFLL